MLKEIVQIIIKHLDTILVAVTSFAVTFFRTREKAIQNKVNNTLSSLDGIYVVIGDKEYALKNLTIYKK